MSVEPVSHGTLRVVMHSNVYTVSFEAYEEKSGFKKREFSTVEELTAFLRAPVGVSDAAVDRLVFDLDKTGNAEIFRRGIVARRSSKVWIGIILII